MTIRARIAYTKIPNGKLAFQVRSLVQNLRDHPEHFGNPPIPLDQVDKDIDKLQRLSAEALDGARTIRTQLDQQREVVISDMRILVNYVETASDGNKDVFDLSGLGQAYATRAAMQMLSPLIRKIERGENSGELWIYIKANEDAQYYEMQYALVEGDEPTEWINQFIPTVKSATILKGLTAGANYAFQARFMSKSTGKLTDWTESVTFRPF